MEDFLDKVWERKLWVLSTSIALFCLNFVFTNSFSIKDGYLNSHQKFVSYFQDIHAEQARQLKVIDLYRDSVNELDSVLQYYRAIYVKHRDAKVSVAEFQQGVDVSKFAISNIENKVEALNGIHLADERYKELQAKIVDAMKRLVDILHATESYFQSKGSESKSKLVSDKYNLVMNYNLSIAESVIPAFSKVAYAEIHDIQRDISNLQNITIKSWFWITCILYIFFFLAVTFYKYYHYLKLKKSK